jgi:hypothetical protein
MPNPVAVGTGSGWFGELLRRAPRVCSASRSSSSIVTFSVLRWLLRIDDDRRRRAGLGVDHHRHEAVAVLHRLAVEFDDDVAGLEPAFLRRASRIHRRDERAARASAGRTLSPSRR